MKNMYVRTNSQRRGFLTKLAGFMGVGLLASPTGTMAGNHVHQNNEFLGPEEWLGKLNGKHKMVFDVTQPHGIFPFAWPRVFLLTNQATGTPEKENNVVVVLRHNGFPYAISDRLWEKYKLGEAYGINDHLTGKPALRNPMWHPKPGEFAVPGIGPVQIGIKELQDSGVVFCICDMALTVNSYALAGKMKMDGAEIKKEMLSEILPDINLVPSGIWAVGRAQEKGCAYCFAS